MKHVFIISLTAAFCLTACSGNQTELKGRPLNGAPQKTANKTGENVTDGDDGILNMPTNTTNRKILVNGSATRNIFIGENAMTTTVFCTKNLVQAQKEKEKIKLQGKSQIIVRQVTNLIVPEEDSSKSRIAKSRTPKTLVSLSCYGESDDLSKEAANQNVTVVPLTIGKSEVVAGKFNFMSEDQENQALVLCVSAADMAKANDALLPEDKENAADILMAVNSKLLIETSTKDKDLKKHILVTCDDKLHE